MCETHGEVFVASKLGDRLTIPQTASCPKAHSELLATLNQAMDGDVAEILVDKSAYPVNDLPTDFLEVGGELGVFLAGRPARIAILIDEEDRSEKIIGALAYEKRASVIVTADRQEAEDWLIGVLR